eukprot:TRINITY_DN22249_c0_g1_i1.p1 TRINITY_DN22249_c0_g1~~TRINITY_DN22249_c0_g1_i1.p1  ORF type:complete len:399 (-),score=58.04 TRINITY_DN22249_c0_g1_i1:57-1199(-)
MTTYWGALQIHVVAWIIAGIFALMASLVSMYLIAKHLLNYTRPKVQRHIVRILFMVPIYATDSWLSLRFHDYALIFDLARDSYEAYVIYEFFYLLVDFISISAEEVGGLRREATIIEDGLYDEEIEMQETDVDFIIRILEKKEKHKHPIPFCCAPKFKPGKKFFTWSRRCILQFVIIKPLLAIAGVIMEFGFDVYADGEISKYNRGYLYVTIIDNASITIAMYFLVLFYTVTKEELKPFKPVAKFLCIKAVILFSFWQGVIIAVISYFGLLHATEDWTEKDISTGLQDFIICCEMFLISLAHGYAFGYKSFRDANKIPILSGKGYKNVGPFVENIGHVIRVDDVMLDAVNAFKIDKGASRVVKAGENAHHAINSKVQRIF